MIIGYNDTKKETSGCEIAFVSFTSFIVLGMEVSVSMREVKGSIVVLIGNTPMVELTNFMDTSEERK